MYVPKEFLVLLEQPPNGACTHMWYEHSYDQTAIRPSVLLIFGGRAGLSLVADLTTALKRTIALVHVPTAYDRIVCCLIVCV